MAQLTDKQYYAIKKDLDNSMNYKATFKMSGDWPVFKLYRRVIKKRWFSKKNRVKWVLIGTTNSERELLGMYEWSRSYTIFSHYENGNKW